MARKTIVKTFTDGSNNDLSYLSMDIMRFAENNNLEIVSMSNIVDITNPYHNDITHQCIVIFKVIK